MRASDGVAVAHVPGGGDVLAPAAAVDVGMWSRGPGTRGLRHVARTCGAPGGARVRPTIRPPRRTRRFRGRPAGTRVGVTVEPIDRRGASGATPRPRAAGRRARSSAGARTSSTSASPSLLFVSSGVLLVVAVDQLLDVFDDFGVDPIVEVLDTLLLVFIFVELLSARPGDDPRARACVAEPFLLVGIIASIKEIVVLSVQGGRERSGRRTRSATRWSRSACSACVVLAARRDGLAAAAKRAGARRRQQAGVTRRRGHRRRGLVPDAAERGNPATEIDRRRGDERRPTPTATTSRVLVHGAAYFARLLAELRALRRGRLDPLHRLAGRPRRAPRRRPAPRSPACWPGWPARACTSAASCGGRTPTRRTSARRRTSTSSRP